VTDYQCKLNGAKITSNKVKISNVVILHAYLPFPKRTIRLSPSFLNRLCRLYLYSIIVKKQTNVEYVLSQGPKQKV